MSLKDELVGVKKTWGCDCKIKAHGKSKDTPWPLTVRVKVPQPSDSRCDVPDVTLTLIIKDVVDGVRVLAVEVKSDEGLPSPLVEKLQEVLVETWTALIAEHCNNTEHMGFALVLGYVVKQFDALMMVCPECVDSYLGTDASGASVRRFTVVEAAADDDVADEASNDDGSEDEDEGLSLEERLQQIELREQEAKISARSEEALREKEAWAAQRRLMAERGMFEDGEVKRVSKKEQEAAWQAKHKQGVRQSKTGANKKKYDGPGSKVEKENAGKKKKSS